MVALRGSNSVTVTTRGKDTGAIACVLTPADLANHASEREIFELIKKRVGN